jgi:hypothetical protein
LPDEKLKKMYYEVDWETFKGDDPEYIHVRGISVPYVVFHNMPSQTDDPKLLGPALDKLFSRLWEIRNS